MSPTGDPPQFSPADDMSTVERTYMQWSVNNAPAAAALQALMADLAQQQLDSNTITSSGITANSIKFDSMISLLSALNAADGMTNTLLATIIASMPLQPNIFKYIDPSASGTTDLWTPASGKKFRLMAYSVETASNISLNATLSVSLLDGAAAIGAGSLVWAPLLAVATGSGKTDTGWRFLGNGYLSTTANNKLRANLSGAVAAGSVRVNVMGREE